MSGQVLPPASNTTPANPGAIDGAEVIVANDPGNIAPPAVGTVSDPGVIAPPAVGIAQSPGSVQQIVNPADAGNAAAPGSAAPSPASAGAAPDPGSAAPSPASAGTASNPGSVSPQSLPPVAVVADPVRWDHSQNLTGDQQTQARDNIDAASRSQLSAAEINANSAQQLATQAINEVGVNTQSITQINQDINALEGVTAQASVQIAATSVTANDAQQLATQAINEVGVNTQSVTQINQDINALEGVTAQASVQIAATSVTANDAQQLATQAINEVGVNTQRITQINQDINDLGGGSAQPVQVILPVSLTPGDVDSDTLALQTALDAARVSPGVRAVFIDRMYIVNQAIVVSGSGVALIGANRRTCGIQQTNAGADGILLGDVPLADGETEPHKGIKIANLRITGAGTSVSTATGLNLHDDSDGDIYNGGFVSFQDVEVRGFDLGVNHRRWDNVRYEGCEFSGNNRSGFFANFTQTVIAINCVFSGHIKNNLTLGVGARVKFMGCDYGGPPSGQDADATDIIIISSGAGVFDACNFERVSPGSSAIIESALGAKLTVTDCEFAGAGSGAYSISVAGVASIGDCAIVGFASGGGRIKQNGGSATPRFFASPSLSSSRVQSNMVFEGWDGQLFYPNGIFDYVRNDAPTLALAGNRSLTRYRWSNAPTINDEAEISIFKNGEFRWESIVASDVFRTVTNTSNNKQLAVGERLRNQLNGTRLVYILPSEADSNLDDVVQLIGLGTSGWELRCNADQRIFSPAQPNGTPLGGNVQSITRWDSILVKKLANGAWSIIESNTNDLTYS